MNQIYILFELKQENTHFTSCLRPNVSYSMTDTKTVETDYSMMAYMNIILLILNHAWVSVLENHAETLPNLLYRR